MVLNYRGSKNLQDIYPKLQDENDHSNTVTGIFGLTPGIVGMYQVNEALKIILDIGELLINKIMYINLLHNSFRIMEI